MLLAQSILRAAQTNPGGEATVCDGRRRTWVEVFNTISRLASGLISLGATPGDRIAILGLNSDSYIEALYAIWWCGGVVVPMNTRWSAPEHAWSLVDSGARILLHDNH